VINVADPETMSQIIRLRRLVLPYPAGTALAFVSCAARAALNLHRAYFVKSLRKS